jgi:FMN reductase [NAD(P)H]
MNTPLLHPAVGCRGGLGSGPEVGDADIDAVVAAAHHAPLSMHAQHLSLVVVRDAITLTRIAQIAGGRPRMAALPVFICIVADFAKAAAVLESFDAARAVYESRCGLAAAAVDAGLALSALTAAAGDRGIAASVIDTTRLDSCALTELLGLPPLTLPVVGCWIGHGVAETAHRTHRPRWPLTAFRHDEHWQGSPSLQATAAYLGDIAAYWENVRENRPENPPASRNESHVSGDRGANPDRSSASVPEELQ